MNQRIVGCPNQHDPEAYTRDLHIRMFKSLSSSEIANSPLAYRLYRLYQCCGSWLFTDPESVSNLWVEFTLVSSCFLTVDDLVPVDNVQVFQLESRIEFKSMMRSDSGLDTPLSCVIKECLPVFERYFLQSIGCNLKTRVERDGSNLKACLIRIYSYLFSETVALLKDYRNLSRFEFKVRQCKNFEYIMPNMLEYEYSKTNTRR